MSAVPTQAVSNGTRKTYSLWLGKSWSAKLDVPARRYSATPCATRNQLIPGRTAHTLPSSTNLVARRPKSRIVGVLCRSEVAITVLRSKGVWSVRICGWPHGSQLRVQQKIWTPMNSIVKVCASIGLVCLDRRIKKFKRLLVDDWYVQCSTERDDGIGYIPQMREKTTTQDYQSWMYSV